MSDPAPDVRIQVSIKTLLQRGDLLHLQILRGDGAIENPAFFEFYNQIEEAFISNDPETPCKISFEIGNLKLAYLQDLVPVIDFFINYSGENNSFPCWVNPADYIKESREVYAFMPDVVRSFKTQIALYEEIGIKYLDLNFKANNTADFSALPLDEAKKFLANIHFPQEAKEDSKLIGLFASPLDAPGDEQVQKLKAGFLELEERHHFEIQKAKDSIAKSTYVEFNNAIKQIFTTMDSKARIKTTIALGLLQFSLDLTVNEIAKIVRTIVTPPDRNSKYLPKEEYKKISRAVYKFMSGSDALEEEKFQIRYLDQIGYNYFCLSCYTGSNVQYWTMISNVEALQLLEGTHSEGTDESEDSD